MSQCCDTLFEKKCLTNVDPEPRWDNLKTGPYKQRRNFESILKREISLHRNVEDIDFVQ